MEDETYIFLNIVLNWPVDHNKPYYFTLFLHPFIWFHDFNLLQCRSVLGCFRLVPHSPRARCTCMLGNFKLQLMCEIHEISIISTKGRVLLLKMSGCGAVLGRAECTGKTSPELLLAAATRIGITTITIL